MALTDVNRLEFLTEFLSISPSLCTSISPSPLRVFLCFIAVTLAFFVPSYLLLSFFLSWDITPQNFYLHNSLSFIIRLIHFIDHPFITIPPIYHIIALPYHIIAPPSHHITTPPTRPGRRVRCACGPRDGRRGHGGDTQLQSVPLHAPGRTETAGGGGRGVCVNEGRTFLTRSLHSFVRLFAWLAG